MVKKMCTIWCTNPITLYSPSFGLNPRSHVIVEYNIPSECGNSTFPKHFTLLLVYLDIVVVSNSPTPSTVRTLFDSLNLEVKKEYDLM